MNENKRLFVLPCRFDPDFPIIFEAVERIRKFHPQDDILVVDSDSSDVGYADVLKNNGVKVALIKNKNYDSGAYWWAYKHFCSEYDFFFFLHDSLLLKKNIEQFAKKGFFSVGYFYHHAGVGNIYSYKKPLVEYIWSELLRKIKGIKSKATFFGFDNKYQFEWVKARFAEQNISLPDRFVSLFGPMMGIKTSLLKELDQLGLSKIQPESKIEQQAMERVWGVFLGLLGQDLVSNSIRGDFRFPNEEYVEKRFLVRS